MTKVIINYVVDREKTENELAGLYNLKLNTDGESYTVVSAKRDDYSCLMLPKRYKGKPVTGIADGAFEGYTAATSAMIPESIERIGARAFFNCTEIYILMLEEGLIEIGDEAFANLSSLNNLSLPYSLEYIGDRAFARTALSSVSIGACVSQIGKAVFAGCTYLESIEVDEDNEYYYSDGQCLIDSQDDTLIAGCNGSEIPNGVSALGEEAFAECEFEEIEIPDNIVGIYDRAFMDCVNLREVTLPAYLESVGEAIFAGCKELSTVYYDNTWEEWQQLYVDENWDEGADFYFDCEE
ncbi:MAG: leucine-rich repeat domain-containing protein [Firmicutes bacterium]|uniref:Leucine-rich repeat domain-containing protein n=1 Tax=Candidatus Stercoripulliclostridium pullicola TaxID=2840953 RepID=A0A940DHL5_9FIRM|nr:leucine-rich repeat domain-containing protein [Candidatus Stercoripulliclostridium pullicola]